MYSYLVNNSEHKNPKAVNKNAFAAIYHNQYKDVSLNKKRLRHSMNRIQSKDYKIGTYLEIRNRNVRTISLSYFDDKIYVQNNGCDGLALRCQSYLHHCKKKY